MKDEWKYSLKDRSLTVMTILLLGLMFFLDAIGLSRISDAMLGEDDIGQV